MKKTCKTCGQEKELADFVTQPHCKNGKSNLCKACSYKALCVWRKAHKEQNRGYQRKALYGITAAEFHELYTKQNGLCACCEAAPEPDRSGRTQLYLDHNHHTNKWRGLLCHHCNCMIGYSRETPSVLRAAALYLEKYITD